MSKYDIGVGKAFPLEESQPPDNDIERCGRRHHHHGRRHHAHPAAVTLLFALAHHSARMARRCKES
jgi:hypothetical protein